MIFDAEPLDRDEDELLDGEGVPPVNGPDGLRIMREQCSTCIFRPGNPMYLQAGRLRDMVESTRRADNNVICHQSLSEPYGALCRGSVDERPGQLARIAERLGYIELVIPKETP